MDEPGEGSSDRPVYGPPKPPDMIERERQAAEQAEGEASAASGNLRLCGYDHEIDPYDIRDEDVEALRELGFTSDDYEIYDEDGTIDDPHLRHGLGGGLPRATMHEHTPLRPPATDDNDEEDDDDHDYETANSGPSHDSEDSGEGLGSPAANEAEDDDSAEEDEEDADMAHEPVQAAPAATIASGILRDGVLGGITRQQLLALLQTQDLNDIFDFNDSDEESVEDFTPYRRRPRRQVPPPVAKPTVEGMKLQRSGIFGANETDHRAKKHRLRRMLDREHGLGSFEDRRRNMGLITQDMIPEMRAESILHYDEPVYSGQFSDDGNFYYSVCQDFKVRMYDTSNPYSWKHYKTVSYPWGSWTLTDASLSPDNKWLVYASHSALVSIAPTDPLDRGDPYTLNLEGGLRGRDVEIARRMNFSIFSIRFSGDGRELVAGTRQNSIVLFDIERRSVLHTIIGHENDVNAVCFGDKDEPHIIYSGSDDGVLKVWDRRSLNDRREAGAFVGHRGGLTYIDSKNDGRYVLSNGKDQTAKLWDVRMAYSTAQFHAEDMTQYTRYAEHDYRYMDDMDMDYSQHPKDNSTVTFRGHKVMRTLIRCHFAPPGSANSRYVYSGSADGKVHIWDMDSTVKKIIDVGKATKGTRRNDGRRRYYAFEDEGEWESCVRDVSWHPHAPIMAASAWNSYNMARGTTSVHSFTDAPEDEDDLPMGRSYDAMMQRQEDLYDVKYD